MDPIILHIYSLYLRQFLVRLSHICLFAAFYVMEICVRRADFYYYCCFHASCVSSGLQYISVICWVRPGVILDFVSFEGCFPPRFLQHIQAIARVFNVVSGLSDGQSNEPCAENKKGDGYQPYCEIYIQRGLVVHTSFSMCLRR